MLSEQIRDKKRGSIWFHLYELTRTVRFIETERKMVVTKDWREEGMGSYCLMGTEFLFGKMQTIPEMDGGDGCITSRNIFNASELYT